MICTDKTGTLTAGQMTVRALYVAGQRYQVTGDGYGPEGTVAVDGEKVEKQPAALLALGTVLLGCNNAQLSRQDGQWLVIGDPTEGALLAAGAKAGADRAVIEQATPKHCEIPFDSDRKRSTVIRAQPDRSLRSYTNGAPDVLLALCVNILDPTGVRVMNDADRERIEAENAALAGQGLRVLGSAWRDLAFASPADLDGAMVEADLVFVGLTGMYDPPRQEAKDAVARCRAAGIRVVMITGDHPHTAMAIARSVSLARPTLPSQGRTWTGSMTRHCAGRRRASRCTPA